MKNLHQAYSWQGFAPILLVLGMSATAHTAQAQSITAAPDGTGTIINHNGNTYHIEGGTQAGANLFHSFQQFGLNPQEIANFLSNPQIQNVLGRVTGGDPSIIQGLIQLSGGNSNLFLMNPAGWVFTQGASLDVPGSFGVTTATRMAFGEGYFNAYGENLYSELLGNPTSLIFDQENPSLIVNEGNLSVPEGESLWMVGGGVISTGTIEAPNGNITIAAVPGKNQIELSSEGMVIDLVLKATPTEGEVTLPQDITGIKPTDIPALLTGGNVKEADTVVIGDDGSVRLVASDTAINQGDTVIAGNVTAENITLMAAGRVTPTDYDLVSNNPTVVLFPETAESPLSATAIDSRADNALDLLYGGTSGTISRIIERNENGIHAITDLVEDVGENVVLDALNIVAEGNEAEVWLGNAFVTAQVLEEYREDFQKWGMKLSETGDILLYSCLTALGEQGKVFVTTLAEMTKSDVAASTNVTGSANYGGDWLLEYQIGNIEAKMPFMMDTLNSWNGKLATITVTNTNDTGGGSLREAIETLAADGDLIESAVTGTINFGSEIAWATNNLTLNGNGLILDGGGTNRIFNISVANATIENVTIQNGSSAGSGGGIYHGVTGGTLTINNSTISGNSSDSEGGGVYSAAALTINNSTVSGNSSDSGGGVYSDAALTINNSTVSDNLADSDGGGIFSTAALTINNSTVSGNSSDSGGGVYSQSNTTINNSTVSGNSSNSEGGGVYINAALTINNSTVSGNSSDSEGGGVYSIDDVTINNSTVSGNSSNQDGGGVYGRTDVTINNSTVSGNSANGRGGGVNSDEDLIINNSTVSGNSANGNGGGVYSNAGGTILNSTIVNNVADADNNGTGDGGGIFRDGTTNTFTIQNSIIAQNTDNGGEANDLSGTFDTIESSLIQDTTGATITTDTNNLTGVDPQLMPLGDYGGTTQTHALKLTSPALNAGNNALATSLTTDQRGAPGQRIVDGTVDIGAFEWQGFEIVPIGQQNLTLSSVPSTLDVSVKVAEAGFNVIPSVGANVDFSSSGTVEGSFTNGTTVVTNAEGIAINFFEVLSATGDFQILAGVTGLESLTLNITNAVPEEAAAAAAAAAGNISIPDFTPIWQLIIDELEEDVLLGNACQTVPEMELELDDDGEELELEEEEEEEQEYDRDCRPVSDEREDIE